MIDYKELLRKYIQHVDDSEGTTFLDSQDENVFSDEEWIALEEVKPKYDPLPDNFFGPKS